MYHLEKITCGDCSAIVNLSRGANCISLKKGVYSLLREPDYEHFDNPYLYGMPILFPVNRISGGSFTFEGRTYDFPVNEPLTNCHLHGMLHETEFALVRKDASSLLCRYAADKNNPYLSFPHTFSIEMEYCLHENGLRHTVRITNLSSDNMPDMLGFHTTFRSLFANGTEEETFAFADIREEYERNMENYLPTGNIPDFDNVSRSLENGTFQPCKTALSRHYLAGKSGKMVIYDRKNDVSLVYENDAKYKFRLIYGQKDYICLEPQNCMANCVNGPFGREKAGFDFIPPGETKTFVSEIRIEQGDKRK